MTDQRDDVLVWFFREFYNLYLLFLWIAIDLCEYNEDKASAYIYSRWSSLCTQPADIHLLQGGRLGRLCQLAGPLRHCLHPTLSVTAKVLARNTRLSST